MNTFKYDTTGVKETTVYTYDNNGNMTGKSLESSRTINPAAPPTTKYWMYFDGEGTQNPNVPASILSGTASYEYDVWNQMVKASTGDGITENKYNGEGLRVEKTVNGVTTRYIYESDKVVLELSDKGVQTGRNIQGINLLTRVVDGLTLNYFYNGHADVTALMNADGTLAPPPPTTTMHSEMSSNRPAASETTSPTQATSGTRKRDFTISTAGCMIVK